MRTSQLKTGLGSKIFSRFVLKVDDDEQYHALLGRRVYFTPDLFFKTKGINGIRKKFGVGWCISGQQKIPGRWRVHHKRLLCACVLGQQLCTADT